MVQVWPSAGKLILARPLLWMLLKIRWSLCQIWDHVYRNTLKVVSLLMWRAYIGKHGGRMAWDVMSLDLQRNSFWITTFVLDGGSEHWWKFLDIDLGWSPGWDISSMITAFIHGAEIFKRKWKCEKGRERGGGRERNKERDKGDFYSINSQC